LLITAGQGQEETAQRIELTVGFAEGIGWDEPTRSGGRWPPGADTCFWKPRTLPCLPLLKTDSYCSHYHGDLLKSYSCWHQPPVVVPPPQQSRKRAHIFSPWFDSESQGSHSAAAHPSCSPSIELVFRVASDPRSRPASPADASNTPERMVDLKPDSKGCDASLDRCLAGLPPPRSPGPHTACGRGRTELAWPPACCKASSRETLHAPPACKREGGAETSAEQEPTNPPSYTDFDFPMHSVAPGTQTLPMSSTPAPPRSWSSAKSLSWLRLRTAAESRSKTRSEKASWRIPAP
jgi:hypothetical protein